MSTNARKAFTSVFDNTRAVEDYIEIGWNIFPLTPGAKNPWGGKRANGWPDYKIEDAKARFDRAPSDCNIGLIIPEGMMVSDVDPRNFLPDQNSWEEFVAANGGYAQIPETWHSTTGSGGDHYYWNMPEGMEPKEFSRDYPGIDIKKRVGYVVIPPSITKKEYVWNLSPRDMEIADAPDFLIQEKGAFDPRQDSQYAPANNGSGDYIALPQQELAQRFTKIYLEGERNDTLPKLIGTFKGRGICHHCTIEFLHDWQEDYFMPPMPVVQGNDEISRTVIGMYKRDGKLNNNTCKHDDEFHIIWLRDLTDPVKVATRAAQQAHTDAHPKITDKAPSEPILMQDGATALNAKLRSKQMYQAIKDFTTESEINPEGHGNGVNENSVILSDDKNTELSTYTALGRQLGVSGTKSTYLVFDPTLSLSKEALLEMQEQRLVLSEREAERLAQCGWVVRLVCKTDGEQGNTHASCKLGVHGACPTHMTYKLRQVAIPALEEGEYYREVWFTGLVHTEGTDSLDISVNIEEALKKFQVVVGRANGWKDTKKLIMARSVSFRLERPWTTVTYRVMVKEEYVGQADRTIKKIEKATHSSIIASRRFQNAEQAAVQLMLNSMSSLNHIWDNRDTILFEAYRLALRGMKAFQSMGVLWGLMKGVAKREAPKCTICGADLDMIIVRPEESDNPSAHNSPYLMPTGSDPPRY